MRTQIERGLACGLPALEGAEPRCFAGDRVMEFHVRASLRSALGVSSALFKTTGNLVIPDFSSARVFAERLRKLGRVDGQDTTKLSAGKLNAMGLIDEILHVVIAMYRRKVMPDVVGRFSAAAREELGAADYEALLGEFTAQFPPSGVYQGIASAQDWLEGASASPAADGGMSVPNRELALEELILLKLANENPAFRPFRFLFDDGTRPGGAVPESVGNKTRYEEAFAAIERLSAKLPAFGPAGAEVGLMELLRAPAREAPDSLEAQLAWIREHWGATFDEIGLRILQGLDLITEEETPRFPPGRAPVAAYRYSASPREYEKFTQDKDWMPSLVLLAKNVLVWFHQLSAQYGRPIARLDQVPDQELDTIASRGINGLWLIGIWQRSPASEKIKKYCGNPEAAASAYSLFDYDIAPELGGWEALDALRGRCLWRGIRLAADMVPNHTGIDSAWVRQRPDLFVGSDHCPFPAYTFNGPDLSEDPSVGIWLEDHYYSRTDAAVVFKRMDRRTGKVRYIYHGNDGTGMAWNDTAQIDFLNPEAREAVRERILHVARHFSIIRFDAAMVLAKQHIRRLWYPAPGSGGAIPSRAEHSIPEDVFEAAMPREFWREVVDECAEKSPDTLLLAEAFWMMEGYFTRTLGMHRVYNSAFMNMLKEEKNSLYRLTIKNTQEFDKQILKRFVNFMSNPDEETAIAQFGDGDKYFGVCTLLATMPGMPMIGHGQIEGFTEKYGMEYRRAYRDEKVNEGLVARHEREIFPLLRMRRLFAEVANFYLFDFVTEGGRVDENVFAYSNGAGKSRALVFYNNAWKRTTGKIWSSCAYQEKDKDGKKRLETKSLVQALGLDPSPRSFLAARELRSGLWHIFRCSDLEAQGWRVELEGYQSLIFAEFTRVHDMDGSYERLWASLKGAGIEDLDDALEEAAHPDLYWSLEKSIETIMACADALGGGMAAEAAAEAGKAAEAFFSRLAQAVSQEEGPSPGISAVSGGRTVVQTGIALIETMRSPAMGGASTGGSRGKALAEFRRLLASPKGLRAVLYYIFIESLSRLNAGANKTEELRYTLEKYLVRKKLLQAAARAAGKPEEAGGAAGGGKEPEKSAKPALSAVDEPSVCSLVFAFATRPRDTAARAVRPESRPAAAAASPERERAAELIRWANADGEAKEALGINSWEGIDYFNKEKFEALLELWPCFALLEEALTAAERAETLSGQALAELLEKAAGVRAFEVRDIMRAAEEGSGFRMADLLSSIENG